MFWKLYEKLIFVMMSQKPLIINMIRWLRIILIPIVFMSWLGLNVIDFHH